MSRRRQVNQMTLIELISPEAFTPRGTGDVPVDSSSTYRISDEQRFPSWALYKKQRLVESVLKDYPIHAFIMTRHNPSGDEEFYYVQDGQTRMTALQEYLLDGFACEPGTIGDGRKFSELPKKLQTAFETYQATVEIFKSTAGSTDEMADIFDRLNSGKPLSDNDKFHSRMTISPVMKFVVEVKGHPELRDDFSKFVGTVGTGKTRKLLGDITGVILAVATRHGDQGGRACINTSYEQNHKYLGRVFSAEQKADVISFFKAYFVRLHATFDTTALKPQKRYGKLSGALGLSACAWVTTGAIPEAISWYVGKLFYIRDYMPDAFRSLTQADIRNCQGAAIKNRLDAIEKQWRVDQGLEVLDLEVGALVGSVHSTSGSEDEDEDEEED